MQQTPPPSEIRPQKHILEGSMEVAGYFEQGIWKPITFAEFIRLVEESPDGLPPKYIKPIAGFVGITVVNTPLAFIPALVFPHFCDKSCAGEACRECPGIRKEGS